MLNLEHYTVTFAHTNISARTGLLWKARQLAFIAFIILDLI